MRFQVSCSYPSSSHKCLSSFLSFHPSLIPPLCSKVIWTWTLTHSLVYTLCLAPLTLAAWVNFQCHAPFQRFHKHYLFNPYKKPGGWRQIHIATKQWCSLLQWQMLLVCLGLNCSMGKAYVPETPLYFGKPGHLVSLPRILISDYSTNSKP